MSGRRFFERVKRAHRRVFRVIQAVLLRVCLFGVYYVGFGMTRLVMTVFGRRMLWGRRPREGATFWREAKGYELDAADLLRQS